MRPIYRTGKSPIPGENPPDPLGRHVVVDLETTGLSPRQGHRIIEIGAVAVEDGAVVGRVHDADRRRRSDPHRRCRRSTGSPTRCSKASPSRRRPSRAFPPSSRDSVLIAHNAAFEVTFLRHEFARLKLGFPNRHVCTLEMSRRRLPPPAGLHPGDGLPAPLPRRRLPPAEPPRPRRRPDDGEDLAHDDRGPMMEHPRLAGPSGNQPAANSARWTKKIRSTGLNGEQSEESIRGKNLNLVDRGEFQKMLVSGSGFDLNYGPMEKIFGEVIERTLRLQKRASRVDSSRI